MKFKTIFKIFLVLILAIILFGVVRQILNLRADPFSDLFPVVETLDLPVVTRIDTIIVKITIKDTVVLTKTKIIYTEKDTIAVNVYKPKLENLSGSLHIEYNYTTQDFKIINNLEVETIIIETEIETTKYLPAKWFRSSVAVGAFGGKENGIILIGAGLVIKNKLSLYPAALSNKLLGGFFTYTF